MQNKFRNELTPHSSIMPCREFLIKDAYSFHINETSLQNTFDDMHAAYCRIFKRLNLQFRAVDADSGSIGGAQSIEFHVLADSGEDAIAYSTEDNYAANIEKAIAISNTSRPAPEHEMSRIKTPNVHTIDELCNSMNVPADQTIKTLLVKGSEEPVIAVVLRGDHELNVIKLESHESIAKPTTFANEEEIMDAAGCEPGSIGPVGLKIPVIVDTAASILNDFVCGSNENGKHLQNVNWVRDLPEGLIADIRNVAEGDPSPTGKGILRIVRGIEVGHIFQLGDKYSTTMDATVLNEQGKKVHMQMGCYGIGVSRVIAAAIEQNNDERGIIWPTGMTPFQIAITPINMHKSEKLATAAEALYETLKSYGYDVLFDDRKTRPGIMFADMELIGIPHRIVMSDRGLEAGIVEYKGRTDKKSVDIEMDGLHEHLERVSS